jgi:hypothetical protein
MSDELNIGPLGKIIIGSIVSLILLGVGSWAWGTQPAWNDTGHVSWLWVGQKTFTSVQGFAEWTQPYKFAVTSLTHGTWNFTNDDGSCDAFLCVHYRFGDINSTKPVGIVHYNGGQTNLVFDP